jgi:hypothetical protein
MYQGQLQFPSVRHEERENRHFPAWMTVSFAELRRLLNILWPPSVLIVAFQLKWWAWRHKKRLQAIMYRYRTVFQLSIRLIFNVPMRL